MSSVINRRTVHHAFCKHAAPSQGWGRASGLIPAATSCPLCSLWLGRAVFAHVADLNAGHVNLRSEHRSFPDVGCYWDMSEGRGVGLGGGGPLTPPPSRWGWWSWKGNKNLLKSFQWKHRELEQALGRPHSPLSPLFLQLQPASVWQWGVRDTACFICFIAPPEMWQPTLTRSCFSLPALDSNLNLTKKQCSPTHFKENKRHPTSDLMKQS